MSSCCSAQRSACLQREGWRAEKWKWGSWGFVFWGQPPREGEKQRMSWAGWIAEPWLQDGAAGIAVLTISSLSLAWEPKSASWPICPSLLTLANSHPGFFRNPRNSIFNFQDLIWKLGMCAVSSLLQIFTPAIIHTYRTFSLKLGLITHKVLLPQL